MQKSKPNQKTQKTVEKVEAPKKDKLKKNQKPKFEEEEDEVVEKKNIDQVMEEDVEEDEKPQRPQKKANKGKKVVKEESEEEDEGDFDDDDGVYNVDLGDDDFYIPSKKAKLDKNKAKTTKKEKIDDSKMEEEKTTANKSKDKKANSKADRFSKKNKDEEKAQRGILYIGHLPYGFVEEGIKEFFQQYGDILNIHLARSKKTARSMGFAFIEFKYKDVAKVAADAMNGYMFYGKKIVCRVIEDDQGIRVHTKKFKFIPFNKKFIEQKNMEKDPAQVKREIKSLLKLEERRREKLKELNIEYDFPGFKAAIDQAKQQSEHGEN